MPSESPHAEEAAFKRAIMRVKPDYFSWSVEEQERYRVRKRDAETRRFEQALLKELFAIRVTTQKALDEACDAFDHAQYLRFNSAALPLKGIGDDLFFLNEYFADDETLLDFATLYDYSYDDYCFQEQVRKQDDPTYAGQPYRGDLQARWARLRIDGAFSYATLSSMASHLYTTIEGVGHDTIDTLIPHEYVHGKDHGKREGNGFRFDLQVRAHGMEAQLKALQERCWRYLAERYEALLSAWDQQAQGRVYIVAKAWDNEPHTDFIFSDQTALKAVRFRHFLTDCRRMPGDPQELQSVQAQETQAIIAFLEHAYHDIVEHFDPKILPFRKRRKIVVAEEALKDFFPSLD